MLIVCSGCYFTEGHGLVKLSQRLCKINMKFIYNVFSSFDRLVDNFHCKIYLVYCGTKSLEIGRKIQRENCNFKSFVFRTNLCTPLSISQGNMWNNFCVRRIFHFQDIVNCVLGIFYFMIWLCTRYFLFHDMVVYSVFSISGYGCVLGIFYFMIWLCTRYFLFQDMVVYSVLSFLFLVSASLVASTFDFYKKMDLSVPRNTIQKLVICTVSKSTVSLFLLKISLCIIIISTYF